MPKMIKMSIYEVDFRQGLSFEVEAIDLVDALHNAVSAYCAAHPRKTDVALSDIKAVRTTDYKIWKVAKG